MAKLVLIRVYKYEDPYKGLGDAGTVFYTYLEEGLEIMPDPIFGPTQMSKLSDSATKKLIDKGYDRLDMGWMITDKQFRNDEIERLNRKLEATKII